jgi:hypothetical protein
MRGAELAGGEKDVGLLETDGGTTPSTQTDSHPGRASVQLAAGRSPF